MKFMNASNTTIKEGTRVRAVVWPNLLCMMLLIAIGCTPYLGYNVSNFFKLLIAIFWVFTTFILHSFTGKEFGFSIVAGFLFYFVLQLLYSMIGVSREILFFLARFHIYLIPIALVYIYNYYNIHEIRTLWLFFMSVFALNVASNIIIGITQGELAFRPTDDTVNTNAGSTSFVVGCMLFIPVLWVVVRNSAGKILKLFSILFIVALAYYILFLNTRATALIILMVIILGFLLIELSREKQLTKRKLVFRMIIVAGLAALLMKPIIAILSNAFADNLRMLSRIEDLSFVMEQGDVEQLDEGSLYTRSLLWTASISTFLSSVPHFLFGVGESVIETDVWSLLAHGVGNHSEFFDLAARYGMIGIFTYYYIIKNTYRLMNTLSDNERIREYLFVLLLGVMLFGFANNLSNNLTTMVLIYFALPTTLILINRKAI